MSRQVPDDNPTARPPWLVPDRARLSDLIERRRWLSRPDIVYELPDVGALIVAGEGAPLIAFDAAGWRAVEASAQQRFTAEQAAAARELWVSAWSAPDEAGAHVVLLLHSEGLLRAVSLHLHELPEPLQSAATAAQI